MGTAAPSPSCSVAGSGRVGRGLRLLSPGGVQELHPIGENLDPTSSLAGLAVAPALLAKRALDEDLAALGEVRGARLGELPEGDHVEEVGVVALAGAGHG